MPDLQDLADSMMEVMVARREAVSRAIDALTAIAIDGAPKRQVRRAAPKKAALAAPRKARAGADSPGRPLGPIGQGVLDALAAAKKPIPMTVLRDRLMAGPTKGWDRGKVLQRIYNFATKSPRLKKTPAGVSLA